MGVTVEINTAGLSAFALKLRELLASFPAQEREYLMASAEIVRDDAKKNAEGSKKTVGTIRVIPIPPIEGRQAVAIGAGESGGSLYPLLREGGNSPKKRFTSWVHPTFGHDPEVLQLTHPYLRKALEDDFDLIEETAGKSIEADLNATLSGEYK